MSAVRLPRLATVQVPVWLVVGAFVVWAIATATLTFVVFHQAGKINGLATTVQNQSVAIRRLSMHTTARDRVMVALGREFDCPVVTAPPLAGDSCELHAQQALSTAIRQLQALQGR